MGVRTIREKKLDAARQAAEAFTVTQRDLKEMRDRFAAAMASGLAGQPSSLKMLPSYIGTPNGSEQGEYLAIDFGGTNVRVLKVALLGSGRIKVKAQAAAPLADPAAGYDYTKREATAEELFDFIAGLVAQVADPGIFYRLGHTFSYPCRQAGLNEAVLISWTKEIKTAGVEGRDVTSLLAAALKRRHLANVSPRAVINDTTGVLLAAAYTDPAADIGSICGTGHNTCYLERTAAPGGRPMIINMESGNFDGLPPMTAADAAIDAASERPGAQLLEKRVAGRYLGEIFRRTVLELAGQAPLWNGAVPEKFCQPDGIRTEALAAVLTAGRERASGAAPDWLPGDAAGREALGKIAASIVRRAGRLAAATYAGTLLHIDPAGKAPHTIAIDGALFHRLPGYAAAIEEGLAEIAGGGRTGRLRIMPSPGGSGLGAAIAAAIAP